MMNAPNHIKKQTWLLLREELSEEEQKRFLEEIESDEAVSDIVMSEVIRHSGRIALKQKLENIHHSYIAKSQVQNWPWIAIAASVLILGLSFMYWQSTQPKDLYQTYFEAYRAPVHYRGDDTTQVAKLWDKTIKSYRAGNFVESINHLETLTQLDTNPRYQFYLAMSYLAISPPEIEKAIPILEQISTIKGEMYQQTMWYLALVYWKNGQTDEARKTFNFIASQSGFFHQQEARDILAVWE